MSTLISRACTTAATACFLFIIGASCSADVVLNLDAIEDTTIYSNLVDNNGGGHGFGIAGIAGNGNERRMLVRFDLSGIAPGSTINSARLDFNVLQNGGAGTNSGTYSLFRVDTNWGEGTQVGNQGSAASAGEATWNAAEFGSVNWATPGGTFFTPVLSDVNLSSTGAFSFDTTANFTAAVQAIVDDPTQNFGFIITTTDPNSAIQIGSIEGDNPSTLVVDFTAVPEPTGITFLVLGFVGLGLRRSRN